MTANQVFLIFMAFVAIVSLLLPALSLKLGLKWAKVANVSLLKTFGLYLLALLLNIAVGVCAISIYMLLPVPHSDVVMNLIGGVTYFFVICALISLFYKVSFRRAILGVIPAFAFQFALLGILFIERAFVYQA